MVKIINESMHRKGDRVKIHFWADPHDGEVGTVTGSIGEVCWVKLDSGEVVKVVNAYLDDYDSVVKEGAISEISRYTSREELMDKVASMYMDYPIWHSEMDEILIRNGASEDDSSPEGFMKGMTVRQIRQVIREFKDLIKRKEAMYESVNLPYMFHYECNNPTFGYDFQRKAEALGCKKVTSRYKGKYQTTIFYLCPSEEVYDKLKTDPVPGIRIGKLSNYDSNDYPIKESNNGLKYFALIEKDSDTVINVGKFSSVEDAEEYFAPALNPPYVTCQEISKEEYDVYKNNFDIQDDLDESYDDDEYSDFDDDTVKSDKSFDYEGFDYVWVERHGDVQHLDFDNWAVWEAWCLDTDESLFFVVDEDTGFIDWGPCETVEIARDFLDSKVEDWENDL